MYTIHVLYLPFVCTTCGWVIVNFQSVYLSTIKTETIRAIFQHLWWIQRKKKSYIQLSKCDVHKHLTFDVFFFIWFATISKNRHRKKWTHISLFDYYCYAVWGIWWLFWCRNFTFGLNIFSIFALSTTQNKLAANKNKIYIIEFLTIANGNWKKKTLLTLHFR